MSSSAWLSFFSSLVFGECIVHFCLQSCVFRPCLCEFAFSDLLILLEFLDFFKDYPLFSINWWCSNQVFSLQYLIRFNEGCVSFPQLALFFLYRTCKLLAISFNVFVVSAIILASYWRCCVRSSFRWSPICIFESLSFVPSHDRPIRPSCSFQILWRVPIDHPLLLVLLINAFRCLIG